MFLSWALPFLVWTARMLYLSNEAYYLAIWGIWRPSSYAITSYALWSRKQWLIENAIASHVIFMMAWHNNLLYCCSKSNTFNAYLSTHHDINSPQHYKSSNVHMRCSKPACKIYDMASRLSNLCSWSNRA